MTELAIRENLVGQGTPAQIMAQATEVADVLTDLLRKKKLTMGIRGREHVLVEGWTALGSLLGVYPVVEWTRPVTNPEGQPNGWEARVEAKTLTGIVVGAAEAQCTRDERMWRSREDYALRSMAQTRATSKALRLPLGFIVSLAGYEATPAEEMPADIIDMDEASAVRHAEVKAPKQEPQLIDPDPQADAFARLFRAVDTMKPQKMNKEQMGEAAKQLFEDVRTAGLDVPLQPIIEEVTELADGKKVSKWGDVGTNPTRVVVLTTYLNEIREALSDD